MPSKKCNKDQIENPKTKRCVSKKGALGRAIAAKKCSAKQVLNPKTGRCISKIGKNGKEIAAKQCNSKQVFNPKTGRCVSKNGAIGRKLLSTKPRKKSKTRSKKSPTRKPRSKAKAKAKVDAKAKAKAKVDAKPKAKVAVRPTKPARQRAEPAVRNDIEMARQALVSRLTRAGVASQQLSLRLTENCRLTDANLPPTPADRRRALLGKGAEGAVYRVLDADSEYVLKVSNELDENFKIEAAISKRLSDNKFNHAPIVADVWSCKGYGYILMEGLSPLGRDKTRNKRDVEAALDSLHDFNIVYPDAHDGNFMRRSDGTVVIIDYGWAYHLPDRKARVENRHRDLYDLRTFTWEQLIAWEMANVADSFGTAVDKRIAYANFGRVWP